MTRSDPDAKTAPGSIVFADNDELILQAIAEFLRGKGYEVHLARDGLEALQVIRNVRPNYVIMDIVMPILDGSRVCWLLRQDPELRNTPVIAFSSLSAQDYRQFPELSADAYVAKGPLTVSFQHILQAIAHLDKKGRGDLSDGIFGYDSLRPRRLVEEMLRERRHYTNVLRSLGEGVLELDQNGRILTATAGACEILGRREAHLVGELLVSFCPPRDRKVIEDLFSELVKARAPERCRAVVRFGDSEIPLQLCAVVEDGGCSGVLAIMESRGTQSKTPK